MKNNVDQTEKRNHTEYKPMVVNDKQFEIKTQYMIHPPTSIFKKMGRSGDSILGRLNLFRNRERSEITGFFGKFQLTLINISFHFINSN
jgi:hypothetical protein